MIELLWGAGDHRVPPMRPSSRSEVKEAPLLLSLSALQQGFREKQQVPGRGRVRLSNCLRMSKDAYYPHPDLLERVLCQLESDTGIGTLVGMQLFGGGTEYGTRKEREALHLLMRRKREAAEDLTEMRGRQSMFSRSDLEGACEDVLFHRS